MIVVELACLALGFGAMIYGSRRAVDAATALAVGSNIPPFVIGLTLLAIGTDLPEFANSIASSISDHGDINVGDSVGSAATQMTLVLGVLPLAIGGAIEVPKKGIAATGAFTVIALGTLALLLMDGHIGRGDAGVLFGIWLVGSLVIHRGAIRNQQLTLPENPEKRWPEVVRAIQALLVLAVASIVALWSIVSLSERFGVPEFLVGFFLASFGTSLPELVFDITALRKGAVAMAIGDVMGSSFVDATASVAIGPLISPTDVTRDLVVRGTLVSLVAIAIVSIVLARSTKHDWRTGTFFLAIYAAFFVAMLI